MLDAFMKQDLQKGNAMSMPVKGSNGLLHEELSSLGQDHDSMAEELKKMKKQLEEARAREAELEKKVTDLTHAKDESTKLANEAIENLKRELQKDSKLGVKGKFKGKGKGKGTMRKGSISLHEEVSSLGEGEATKLADEAIEKLKQELQKDSKLQGAGTEIKAIHRGYAARDRPWVGTCDVLERRPVKLLVTRHGLSCANLVDKWLGTVKSKMHVNMKDPLLSAAGENMTKQAASDVKDWLAEHPDVKVNAVLASHLARAWQTAALQYPNFTITGAPFISETGAGRDNQPRPFEEQEDAVQGKVPGFKVDLNWLKKHGQSTKGNWDEFKDFLATEYLHDLLPSLTTHDAERIVLAVVTHSNFMMEGEIKEKCVSQYPIDTKSNKKKANNNQVVLIHYDWVKMECGPTDSRTTTFRMVDDEEGKECENVVTGTSIYDADGNLKPLCNKDVGEQCQMEFEDAHAWVPPTLESEMEEQDDKYKEKQSQLEQTNERLVQVIENQSKAKSTRASLQRLSEDMATIEGQWKSLKAHQCWLGGNPEYTSEALSRES